MNLVKSKGLRREGMNEGREGRGESGEQETASEMNHSTKHSGAGEDHTYHGD